MPEQSSKEAIKGGWVIAIRPTIYFYWRVQLPDLGFDSIKHKRALSLSKFGVFSVVDGLNGFSRPSF